VPPSLPNAGVVFVRQLEHLVEGLRLRLLDARSNIDQILTNDHLSQVRKSESKQYRDDLERCSVSLELAHAILASGFHDLKFWGTANNHLQSIKQTLAAAIGSLAAPRGHNSAFFLIQSALDKLEDLETSVHAAFKYRPPAKRIVAVNQSRPRQGVNFTFLLLNNLCMGSNESVDTWRIVCDRLVADFDRLEPVFQPGFDLVLFLGDAAQSGDYREFRGFEAFLGLLWKFWNEEKGCHPILLSVPGNHDLSRPKSDVEKRLRKQLKNWHNDDVLKKAHLSFSRSNPSKFQQLINACFADYNASWERFDSHWREKTRTGLFPGDFSTSITKDGHSLGIVGLNSTYLQLDGDDLEGRLAIEREQFRAVCRPSADGVSWAEQQSLCVLMTHHSPEWLYEDCERLLDHEIYPGARISVHFCGHNHQSKFRHRASWPPSLPLVQMASPLFRRPGIDLHGKSEMRHGYIAGRIQIVDRKASIRFWPRLASKDTNWVMQPDSSNFELQKDGGTTAIDITDGLRNPEDVP
jgi:hypothetical protein